MLPVQWVAPEGEGAAVVISRRTRLSVGLVSALVGLLASGCLVWQSSTAAFGGSTANPTANWAAGTVTVSDDDGGSALFTVAKLDPGDSGTRCLRVTYTGTVATIVRFYTTAGSYSGGLGPYLTLSIDEGDAGTYANTTCSDWTGGTAVYSGPVSAFASTHTTYADGAYKPGGAWSPTAGGQSKVYRFAYQLSATTPDSAQGAGATIGFTWEAQG